jgi:C_GCAxxG_C_C family probable redox protein
VSQNKLSKKAVAYFSEGYNCAQSVLMAMSEHWDRKNELIPKIATGFGGGIGRCGSVCGALTGGIMAIGLKYGTNEPSMEKRLKAYKQAKKLYKQFEKRHGSVLCRELIGYDLTKPVESAAAREANVFDERCPSYLATVVETLLKTSE